MRFAFAAVVAAVLSDLAAAWTSPIPLQRVNDPNTKRVRSPFSSKLFFSAVSPLAAENSTASGGGGIAPSTGGGGDVRMGRILEGGQVIDFSSLKASSKAEAALAEARQALLINAGLTSGHNEHYHHYSNGATSPLPPSSLVALTTASSTNGALMANGILGINEDVVNEVGHELGVFCSAQEIQECATYLRSLVPRDAGLFESRLDTSTTSYTPQQVQRYQQILAQGYVEAGEVTGAFAKTFYMGTMLMPEAARKAIWAIYVWCRRTDEIVDAPRQPDDPDMLMDLSSWEMRLENLWRDGHVVDVYDLVLLDVRIQYPTLDIQPFMDMIRGMLMDVPDLGVERYATFDELHLYCYRVAGTVGVMSLPIFGCAPGYNDDIAR
jgi:15-cis-phytoene synthase